MFRQEELLIDTCPKCGMKLEDKFISTRRNHDAVYHPLYTRSKFVNSVKKNRGKILKILLIIILVYSIPIGTIQYVIGPWYHSNFTSCVDVTKKINGMAQDNLGEAVNIAMKYEKDCGFQVVFPMNQTLYFKNNHTVEGHLHFVQYYVGPLFLENKTK